MLGAVVNKVHPLTGESFVQEKTLEELANATLATQLPEPITVVSEDGDSQHDGSSHKKKLRFEPHLVKGEKDGQVRGIFRMDPRHDPTVKVIPGKKSKSGAKSKESQNGARSYKRLTSRDEARSMISSKKAMIEDQFKSPYMNTAHSSRKKSHALEKNSMSNIKLKPS